MVQTYNPATITDYAIDLATRHQRAIGLKAIYYGDLEIIGTVPCLCVEPATLDREYVGDGFRTENTFQIGFIIYHSGSQGVQGIQRAVDIITQKLMDVVNLDAKPASDGGTRFGDLLYQGMVTEASYGYKIKADETMRANRFVFLGNSLTNLVES